MSQQSLELARYHHADRPETLQDFVTPENGLFAIPAIELLVGAPISPHYNGPDTFQETVDWGYRPADELKSTTIEPGFRWQSAEDIPEEYRDRIDVLAFKHPEIRTMLAEVSEIAAKLTRTRYNRPELKRRYREIVNEIMAIAAESFNKIKTPNTVAVTLLRGGLPFEKHFHVEPNRRLRVEAKRLDFHESMMIGFSHWEGLENVQNEDAPESVDLVFPDDCGATFNTVQSAVIALKARSEQGHFPKINKVYVYVSVAAQQGAIFMLDNFKAMGINVKLVPGDTSFQLSNRYYLERAEGEFKNDGTEFLAGHPYVGDMGDNMAEE